MPITHIGTNVGSVADTTSINVELPPGLQAGDLIICATSERYVSVTGFSSVSGFKRLTPLQRLSNSYSTIHFKIATGAESTITATPNGLTYDTCVMSVSVFRGVDAYQPIDAFVTRVGSNSGSTVLPSITPKRNECYVVGIVTKAASSYWGLNADWSGSGYTELGEGGYGGSVGHLIAVGGLLQGMSATIPTKSIITDMSGNWGNFVVSLRPAYKTYVLDDSPSTYWKLDESNKNGTTCVAAVGTNLTYSANVSSINGRQGAAAYFTNSATNAGASSCPESAFLTVQDFTIECWAAIYDAAKLSGLISMRENDALKRNYGLFYHGGSTNTISVDLGGASLASSRWNTGYSPPADRVFRHYVFTYTHSSNTLSLYVNATLVSSTTDRTITAASQGAQIMLGNLVAGSYPTHAALDEVAIYNGTRLTQQQVKDHYLAGIPYGLQAWNGSSWVESLTKVRNAQGGYVEAPAKRWNGYDWI